MQLIFAFRYARPGAEIGRQAWLRTMCSQGREGSSPSSGTIFYLCIICHYILSKPVYCFVPIRNWPYRSIQVVF